MTSIEFSLTRQSVANTVRSVIRPPVGDKPKIHNTRALIRAAEEAVQFARSGP